MPELRTRIKFCGMARAEDIAVAAALGVDAIGLIFAAGSPRRVTAAQAGALAAAAAPPVRRVALFRDNAAAEIEAAIAAVHPQFLQFHGAEPEADCRAWGIPYLRAVPMGSLDADRAREWIARYPSAAGFVLDSHASGGAGGSGRTFDWSRLPDLGGRPWLLAGGLDPGNVFDAVRQVRPWGVDVSSGIESSPGIKDAGDMQRFVMEVRRADARNPH